MAQRKTVYGMRGNPVGPYSRPPRNTIRRMKPRPPRPQACDCNSGAPNQGCPRGYYCKGMTTTGRCTCVKR